MSNYFELIQNISEIKLGKAPSSFSDLTNTKYTKIKSEFKNALYDYYYDTEHNFRKKSTTFSTADGQQEYKNIYGQILLMKIEDSDGNKNTVYFEPEFERMIVDDNDSEDEPYKYHVYNEKIMFYPVPDTTYTMHVYYYDDNPVKNIDSIDQSSTAGQVNLYITSTEGFSAGDVVTIDPNTAVEEIKTISSVVTNDYLVLTANLDNDHSTGTNNVEKYKKTLDYETDTPNFPDKFHNILEYMTLERLYYGDPERLRKYTLLIQNRYKDIKRESRGTNQGFPRFRIGGSRKRRNYC